METAPRPNVRTQYYGFNRAFKVELAMFMVFGPMLFTLWIFAAFYCYYYRAISSQLVVSATFFSIMYFYARMTYASFRRKALGKVIFVEEDKIIKRSVYGDAVLNFADVSGVRNPHAPIMMNRRMVLTSKNKKSFGIPLTVDDGHVMVRRIFKKIEENGLPLEGLADFKRQFYTASKRLNILQKLRAQYMPNLIRTTIATALLHGAVALLFWKRGLEIMLVWGFFNMLLQVAAYFWTELFHVKKILGGKPAEKYHTKKILSGNPEAFEAFNGYYVMAGVIALLVGMVFGVVITEPG